MFLFNNLRIWSLSTMSSHDNDLLRSAWRSQQTFLFLFCFFFFLRSARRSLQTFLFLFCFFFLRSADKVGRPFCFCSVSYYYFFSSFLFFFTATCEPRFLRHFSTNLHEIWHVDSPWWDEPTEYFFKSTGPGVGIRRGPKVLLCFIIGKTLYTVRRDKNFT